MVGNVTKSIDHLCDIIDKVNDNLENIKKSASQQLVSLLRQFSDKCEKNFQQGSIEMLPEFLKDIDLLKASLQTLKQDADKALKEELLKLQHQGQQEINTQTQEIIEIPSQSCNMNIEKILQTQQGKDCIEKAINFVEFKKLGSQIKSTLRNIEYTDNSANIGGIKWVLKQCPESRPATKDDFEKSFIGLFQSKLPSKRIDDEGEYPWDSRVAIIPILLNLKKEGRYGKDQQWHGKGISGFYNLGHNRVLKFDDTGGTVRKKRDSDLKLSSLYVMD